LIHRRDFLGLAAAAPFAATSRVWAAPPGANKGPRVLVVFLRGAYDAANVVIPVSSDFYYQSRPNLQIARPDPANPDAALPLDADFGLHPALKDTIYPLWRTNQVAFVPFAGTDDLSRSHFETQDAIEMGQPIQGERNFGSGFLSRLYGVLGGGARPIAFTDQPPLAFRGGSQVPNIGLGSVGKPGVDDRQARLIQGMYAGQADGKAMAQSVAEGFQIRDEAYQAITQEMQEANRGAVSPKGFEISTRRIARLMKTDYSLGFVDVGGWDTHVNQGAAKGYLADRLSELGRGLTGFVDEIGPQAWNDTVVVVVSEFGRTFKENGGRGTDHGHGSVYWVLGGQVRGGRLAGEQVPVVAASLNQNRDYPVLTDYRALFGGLFQRAYGLDLGRLETVFPNAPPKDLQIV
jgi:uncharacterized protein (DUF1501 family)